MSKSLRKSLFLVISFLLTFYNSYSQIGGSNTYDFLNFTTSARLAALGGDQISIKDNDLNLVFSNPALLNHQMDKNLVVNYVNYYAGINYTYISYAWNLKNFGTVAAGMHAVGYGKFDEADEGGTVTGKFTASEYALNMFWSKEINKSLSVGANVKPVYSRLADLSSIGLLADVGLNYNDEKGMFSASAVVKNIGSEIKPYYNGNYEPVGFDVQAGITRKLKYAPFRLSFLFDNLQKWDLTYNNPYTNYNTIDTSSTRKKNKFKDLGDKIMRHIVIGVEFLPSKNFFVNLGFNYERRKEMVVSTRPYISGFSAGFGIKISKFSFSFTRSQYHLAGACNFFSLSTNISELFLKKN